MHQKHLQTGVVRGFQVVLKIQAGLLLGLLDDLSEVSADSAILRVVREGLWLHRNLLAELPDPRSYLLLPGLPELVLALGDGPHLRLVAILPLALRVRTLLRLPRVGTAVVARARYGITSAPRAQRGRRVWIVVRFLLTV